MTHICFHTSNSADIFSMNNIQYSNSIPSHFTNKNILTVRGKYRSTQTVSAVMISINFFIHRIVLR